MQNKRHMYVDAEEICEDWGVSKSQAYKIIKQLNELSYRVRQTAGSMRKTAMARRLNK